MKSGDGRGKMRGGKEEEREGNIFQSIAYYLDFISKPSQKDKTKLQILLTLSTTYEEF